MVKLLTKGLSMNFKYAIVTTILMLFATHGLCAFDKGNDSLPAVYQTIGFRVKAYETKELKKLTGTYERGDTVTIGRFIKVGKKKIAVAYIRDTTMYIDQVDSLVLFNASSPAIAIPSEKSEDGIGYLFNTLLPYDEWHSWLIVAILSLLLYMVLTNFEKIDKKINEHTGQVDRMPGKPWYILVSMALPAVLVFCVVLFPDTAQAFLNERLKDFSFPTHFVDYAIYTILIANIVALVYAVIDSFNRVGFPFAFLRIGLIYLGMFISIIVGFFASVLIVFIIAFAIIAMFGMMGLSAAAKGAEGQGGRSCPYCNGTGRNGECNHCHGTGRLR